GAFVRRRTGYQDGGQRIAFGVGRGVDEHVAVQRRVLIRLVRVVLGCRRVVHRCHFYRDYGGLARLAAVVRAVSEGVRAVEIFVRRVGEGAVLVQGHRSVGRRGDELRGQRVTVDVRVVSEDAGCGNGQRRVFLRDVAVRGGDRRIVGTLDGNRDRGGLAQLAAVVCAI